MKNQFLALIIIVVSLVLSNKANAQISSSDRIFSLGTSLGFYPKYDDEYNKDAYKFTYSTPIFIQYEKGYGEGFEIEELDNLLSYGVYLGYCNKEYSKDINDGGLQYMVKGYNKFDYFMVGIVANLHYKAWLAEYNLPSLPEKLDLYLSIKVGAVINLERTNYEYVYPNDNILPTTKKDTEVNFYAAPQLGVRYLITKNLGVFTEIGRQNLSWFSLGLSYSFEK